MGHLAELKRSGHWPSLLAAFLHFDTSFVVWIILGALGPFLAADAAISGAALKVTPLTTVTAGRYLLTIGAAHRAAGEAHGAYHLLITSARSDGAAGRVVEDATLDNARPATLAALNARSQFVRVALARPEMGPPFPQTVALRSGAQLHAQGQRVQLVASGLSAGATGLLIALPLLAAAFFRIVLGLLADRYGSKRVGMASLALTLAPLLIGWQIATSYGLLLCVGAFLGVAGASFAVALPLASRWYPPHLQGLALGIAGAGNSGTVVATLAAPVLAAAFGWHAVLGLLMIPVGTVLVVFTLLAKDAPGVARPHPLASYRLLLGQRDTYVFCLLYFVTFGGFVGLSSFLNTFFVDQFHVGRAAVGLATAPFVVVGSLLRPVGGGLADRLGGPRVLTMVLSLAGAALLGVGLMLAHQPAVSALLLVAMGGLGMGNGAVFQVIPQRFRGEIGAITGLVGAVGGLGGFCLNVVLGVLKDSSGAYTAGFCLCALSAVGVALVLRRAARSWSWLPRADRGLRRPEGQVLAVAEQGSRRRVLEEV